MEENPYDPGTRPERETISLALVPYTGRLSAMRLVLSPGRLKQDARRIEIRGTSILTLRLLDRERTAFFIDEDPHVFHGHLTLRVAGSLAFAPGPEYTFTNHKEMTA